MHLHLSSIKKLAWQHKLALMKKVTLVPFEVIDDSSCSLRPITHETKAFEVIIGS